MQPIDTVTQGLMNRLPQIENYNPAQPVNNFASQLQGQQQFGLQQQHLQMQQQQLAMQQQAQIQEQMARKEYLAEKRADYTLKAAGHLQKAQTPEEIDALAHMLDPMLRPYGVDLNPIRTAARAGYFDRQKKEGEAIASNPDYAMFGKLAGTPPRTVTMGPVDQPVIVGNDFPPIVPSQETPMVTTPQGYVLMKRPQETLHYGANGQVFKQTTHPTGAVSIESVMDPMYRPPNATPRPFAANPGQQLYTFDPNTKSFTPAQGGEQQAADIGEITPDEAQYVLELKNQGYTREQAIQELLSRRGPR